MALDTANLSAADSADLMTAARHDGDALTRELAERLSSAEELADRLGNGDELRTANNLLDLALRELRAERVANANLRMQVAGAESKLRTVVGQYDALRDKYALLTEPAPRHVEPMSARTLLPGAPELDAGQWSNALRTIDALLSDNDADDSHYFAQGVQ
jgi:hypothetical protein